MANDKTNSKEDLAKEITIKLNNLSQKIDPSILNKVQLTDILGMLNNVNTRIKDFYKEADNG